MPAHYDVIIIGAGCAGSSAAYHLAKRGKKVLVLERFGVPHTNGSYHGESRLIRFAYQEGAHYVPLLVRAGELWRELEKISGQEIFVANGALTIASSSRQHYLDSVHQSVLDYGLPHKILTGIEVNRLYPAFRLPSDFNAVLDESAGFIYSEKAVRLSVCMAQQSGAEIRTGEQVLSWKSHDGSVSVTTGQGTYKADRLVITPGAWFTTVVPEYKSVIKVWRTAISWYRPEDQTLFTPERLPVFLMQDDSDRIGAYGVPVCDAIPGMKIGQHGHLKEIVQAESVNRKSLPQDEEATRYWIDRYFKLQDAPCLSTAICMYTMTPDEAFILGRHPAYENVILGHACSGHGFKFAPVLGEILADLAIHDRSRLDISAHNPQRFL